MIWLGDRRGFLTDWVTQRWVQITGRKLTLSEHPWLNGPAGSTRHIGKDFFIEYARQHNLNTVRTGIRGLVEDMTSLSGDRPQPCLTIRQAVLRTNLRVQPRRMVGVARTLSTLRSSARCPLQSSPATVEHPAIFPRQFERDDQSSYSTAHQ